MTIPEIPVDNDRLARFSCEEFCEMANAGLFGHRRVELIAGKITSMSPISPPHAAAVSIISDYFTTRLKGRFWVRSQDPINLAAIASMPQPDIVACELRPDRYAFAQPKPGECILLIEVALSSLDFDRVTKRKLYAAAGIREYWILNLRDRQLERFVDGDGEDYPAPTILSEGQSLRHDLLGEVHVADLLPMAAPEALA